MDMILLRQANFKCPLDVVVLRWSLAFCRCLGNQPEVYFLLDYLVF